MRFQWKRLSSLTTLSQGGPDNSPARYRVDVCPNDFSRISTLAALSHPLISQDGYE